MNCSLGDSLNKCSGVQEYLINSPETEVGPWGFSWARSQSVRMTQSSSILKSTEHYEVKDDVVSES